jgi:hypothetical protein
VHADQVRLQWWSSCKSGPIEQTLETSGIKEYACLSHTSVTSPNGACWTLKTVLWGMSVSHDTQVRSKKSVPWNLLQWTLLSADTLLQSTSWVRVAWKVKLHSFHFSASEITIDWFALLLCARLGPRNKSQPTERLSLSFIAAFFSPSRQMPIGCMLRHPIIRHYTLRATTRVLKP